MKSASGALPIKFSARDCNGAFVADNRVSVEVWEGTARKFVATYGEGSDAVRIDDVQGQYIANFRHASGVHTYTVRVLFAGFEQATKAFTTR